MTVSATTAPGRHMRAEIAEQPDLWSTLVDGGEPELDRASRALREFGPELLVLAARGSSAHAAHYAQYLAQRELSVPVAMATPAAATVLGAGVRYPRAALVAVSQSGESPDLVHTTRRAVAQGVLGIGLTNDPSCTVAGLVDHHLDLRAGPERSVAATKSYTAEVLALSLLVRRVAGSSPAVLREEVLLAAQVARAVLQSSGPVVAQLAAEMRDVDRILVVGRGLSSGSAREGALKLAETSAVAASGWSAADLAHGPVAQVVPGTPVIALTGSTAGLESVVDVCRTVERLGGRVVDVGLGQAVVPLPGAEEVAPELLPLVEILPLQLLALELALCRERDPDQPPGLAKVTRTR